MDKKDIIIYSQKDFEDVMYRLDIRDENVKNFEKRLAFISILEPRCGHWFKSNHENVLNIDFYDLETDIEEMGYKAITPEQADEIIDFIEKNQEKQFHIHCHAGLSRSAGVAWFIRDYYDWVDKEKFDRNYKGRKFPNQKVFMELKRAYERKYYKD